MRFANLLLTIGAAASLSGCSTLVSLHPFLTDQQAVIDPALLGAWAKANSDELYIVRQDGAQYTIRHIDKSESQTFSARLVKIGDIRILDLVSANDDPFQLAVHTPMRVWVDGATLRFATLDSDWLKENAHTQLAIQEAGERSLITAPGDAVLRFLIAYGTADDAYGKTEVLQKQQ